MWFNCLIRFEIKIIAVNINLTLQYRDCTKCIISFICPYCPLCTPSLQVRTFRSDAIISAQSQEN